MNDVTQRIVMTSPRHFGRRIPSHAVGQALVAIPNLVRQSIAMAFRGQSAACGKRPNWLKACDDIRLLNIDGDDESILTFEVPTLGKAAPELFRQTEFPWSNLPSADDTGFDLLGDVLTDVARGNAESERFDSRLLQKLYGLHKVLDRTFSEFRMISRRYCADHPAVLNRDTLATAQKLYDDTPRPQAARIVGKLDMIRDSTQTFGLMMDDGQMVRCVMIEDDVASLMPLFKHRVAVSGRAVFRASGRLLRIETESVQEASPGDRLFAKIPTPNQREFDLRRILREQGRKRGVAAILGKWPGDETDEQIDEWIKESS